MEQQQLISLYDFLGYAAGPELGKQVAQTATKLNKQISARQITSTRYKGIVHLYTPQFLFEYFEAKKLGLDPQTALMYLDKLRNNPINWFTTISF